MLNLFDRRANCPDPDPLATAEKAGRAGGLPDGSLGRMTSNAFNFPVCVHPRFIQSATDTPEAGLFKGGQVHRH
jgi:hypothetical protein